MKCDEYKLQKILRTNYRKSHLKKGQDWYVGKGQFLTLEETKKQFELAKVESQKDFPQEAELQEKIKRLAEVDALLNMDKKDHEGAALVEPDEQEIHQKKVVGLER